VQGRYLTEEERLRGRRKNRQWKIKGKYDEGMQTGKQGEK
jgi:hypothetical protein